MNTQNTLLLFSIILFSIHSIAQTESCGFDAYMDYLSAQNPKEFKAAQDAHHSNIDYYRQQHSKPYYVSHPSSNTNALVGGNGCNKAPTYFQ